MSNRERKGIPASLPPRARRGLFLVVGLVVVLFGGILFLRSFLTPQKLREIVVQGTRNALGVEPKLESIELGLLPPRVRARGFAISNVRPGDPPLITCEEFRAQLQLAPLLARALVIKEIVLVRPIVTIRKVGNLSELPAGLDEKILQKHPSDRPAAPPSLAPWRTFAIRGYRIEDGAYAVLADDERNRMSVQGIALRGSLDTANAGKIVTSNGVLSLAGLRAHALQAYAKTLDSMKPVVEYELSYDSEKGAVEFPRVNLKASPLDIQGYGSVSGLPSSPVLQFTVERRAYEMAELLPLIPASLIPEERRLTGSGQIEWDLQLEAALTDTTAVPRIEANLVFREAGLGIEGFPASLERTNGALVSTGDQIKLEQIQGVIAGKPFTLSGTVDHPADSTKTDVDLNVLAEVDLGLLGKAGLAPPGGTIQGVLKADVRIQGRPAEPASNDLQGTVVAQDVTLRLPNLQLPVEKASAHIALRGADAIVESIEARIGRTTLSATGRVAHMLSHPFVELRGSAPILDLNELLPPPPLPGGASPEEHAHFSLGVSAAFAAEPPLPLVPLIPPIDAKLDLMVDSLYTGKNVFSGAKFVATTHAERAQVQGTFATALLGTVTLRNLTADCNLEKGTLTGTFRSPRADAPLVPLTDVTGKIHLGPDRQLKVDDVTATLWSGKITGRADVDLTDLLSPGFRIESKATQLQANDFVSSLTPVRGLLTGAMDMNSVISGKGSVPEAIAQSLSGEGLLNAKGGGIHFGPTITAIWSALGLSEQQTINFRDLATAFELQAGKLVTKDLRIESSEANWLASGSIGFDGQLDYKVQLELNEALSEQYRKKLGRDLAAVLEGTSGRLTLDLGVSGNAKSPRVNVDTKKLAERATTQAKAALQKGIEKEKNRLLDKLQGAIGGGVDSSSTPGLPLPADSTAKQVKDLLKGILKGK